MLLINNDLNITYVSKGKVITESIFSFVPPSKNAWNHCRSTFSIIKWVKQLTISDFVYFEDETKLKIPYDIELPLIDKRRRQGKTNIFTSHVTRKQTLS